MYEQFDSVELRIQMKNTKRKIKRNIHKERNNRFDVTIASLFVNTRNRYSDVLDTHTYTLKF